MRLHVHVGIITTALSLLTAVTTLAQTPGSGPHVGTGGISGRVTAADGSGPLSRAEVSLAGPATGNGQGESHAVTTDAQGRYEFADLPAGVYALTAEKGGYLTLKYGQRPGRSVAQSLEIGDGQSRQGIDVALPKNGVIAVRVTDEFGNPMSGVVVSAARPYEAAGGHRKLGAVSLESSLAQMGWPRTWETDDRGEIRLFNLPSGDYYLMAEFGSNLMDASNERSDRQLIYPPIYYPGTTSASEARPLSLDAGQELGASIALVPARAAHLSGRVVSSDGTPGQGYVVLNELGKDGSSFARFREELSDGKFTFRDITPGEHVIEKRIDDPQSPEDEYGTLSVTVSGENISDLVVTTARAGTFSGQVVFDTGAPPLDLKSEDFAVSAKGWQNDILFFASSDLKEDWSFTIDGVTSPSTLDSPSSDGWFLKEVTLGGLDVTHTPLRAATNLQVVLTQKFTSVTGTVVDDRGAVIVDGTVVIFPEDRSLWISGSPFIVSAPRTDQQGRFAIYKLAPGRYFAAAVDRSSGQDVTDADFLARLSAGASRLTLGEGESKTINLKLTIF